MSKDAAKLLKYIVDKYQITHSAQFEFQDYECTNLEIPGFNSVVKELGLELENNGLISNFTYSITGNISGILTTDGIEFLDKEAADINKCNSIVYNSGQIIVSNDNSAVNAICGNNNSNNCNTPECEDEANCEAQTSENNVIFSNIDENVAVMDRVKIKLDLSIDALVSRINALKNIPIMGEEEFNEIEALYDKWLILSKKYNFLNDFLIDYLDILQEQNEFKKSLEISSKTIDELNKLEFKNAILNVKIRLKHGRALHKIKRYSDAYSAFKETEKYLNYWEKKLDYEVMKVKTDYYNYLSVTCKMLSKYDEAEQCVEKALNLINDILKEDFLGNIYQAAKIYHNAGYIYDNVSKFEKGVEYYSKSIELKEKYNKHTSADEQSLALSYNNIGYVYYRTKEYCKSEDSLKKAISIKEKLYDENPHAHVKSFITSLDWLANVYEANDKINEAFINYDKVIEICIKNEENKDIVAYHLAKAYKGRGCMFEKKYDRDKAIKDYSDGYNLLNNLGRNLTVREKELKANLKNLRDDAISDITNFT